MPDFSAGFFPLSAGTAGSKMDINMVECRLSKKRKYQLTGLALLFLLLGAASLANDSLNTATIPVDRFEGDGWLHLAYSKSAAFSPLIFGGMFLAVGFWLLRLRLGINSLYIRLENGILSYSWIATKGRRFHLPRLKSGQIAVEKVSLLAAGDFAPEPFLIGVADNYFLHVDAATENRKLLEYELKKGLTHAHLV